MLAACLKIVLPDSSGRLQTVHDRHLHIHQHQVECFLLQQAECFGSVVGGFDLQARALEQVQGNLPVDGIVLNQENHAATVLLLKLPEGIITVTCLDFDFVLCSGLQRQLEPEAAAASNLALGAACPPHQLDQPAGNGKAQPGAPMFSRDGPVGLFECFENRFQLLCFQARAGVFNLKSDTELVVVLFDQ